MSDWWSNIEREIDRLGADAPDPWADAQADEAPLALTPDQIAFLEQVGNLADTFADHDDWDTDTDDGSSSDTDPTDT